jgi:hypothetical protein
MENVSTLVRDVLSKTSVLDIHTHLYPPSFANMALWGIDELVTYHYLEAELFRSSDITPQRYFAMNKTQRAEHIWQALFVRNTPVSEACRGVIAVLQAFGLPTQSPDLREAREFFRAQKPEQHFHRVLDLAGVSQVVMTNDPLSPVESPYWERPQSDKRFLAALRLDKILEVWPSRWETMAAGRRFLDEWIARMQPAYMACSLPDTFLFPDETPLTPLLRDAVLPACREHHLPMALMIGVRRQVNPALRDAGDAVGRADLRAVENLCREFPNNRFLVTVLSRENQHELVVYARKFANLMPFGCWWFLNNPSVVEEMTRERVEMLGTTFIPQHSDARILEQVIYKWRNTRRTLAECLTKTYTLLAEDGRPVTRAEIERDVQRMLAGVQLGLGSREVGAAKVS